MIRNADKIGEIYHLGKPRRYAITSMLKIVYFLSNANYTFDYAYNMPKPHLSMSRVMDHINAFERHLTLLPYVGDDIENEIKQDARWQLCIQCGLRYEIVDPDPEIFENSRGYGGAKLIILTCHSWRKLCTNINRELKRVYGR